MWSDILQRQESLKISGSVVMAPETSLRSLHLTTSYMRLALRSHEAE